MSTTSLFTADQLLQLPSGMGQRFELVAGELRVMSPAGWKHGSVTSRLHGRLVAFVEQHDLGLIFSAETGFRLERDPDTVLAPDISFIAKQNLPDPLPAEAYWPGAPDLAVEVLSPGDRTREVHEKIEAWLTAGAQTVWIVDPRLKTVTCYEAGKPARIRSIGERLEGEPVVPGFTCQVDELFR